MWWFVSGKQARLAHCTHHPGLWLLPNNVSRLLLSNWRPSSRPHQSHLPRAYLSKLHKNAWRKQPEKALSLQRSLNPACRISAASESKILRSIVVSEDLDAKLDGKKFSFCSKVLQQWKQCFTKRLIHCSRLPCHGTAKRFFSTWSKRGQQMKKNKHAQGMVQVFRPCISMSRHDTHSEVQHPAVLASPPIWRWHKRKFNGHKIRHMHFGVWSAWDSRTIWLPWHQEAEHNWQRSFIGCVILHCLQRCKVENLSADTATTSIV